MEYSYSAATKQGIKQKGRLEANDQNEVLDYLRQQGLTPLNIKNLEKRESSILGYFSRVKAGDIVLFTRQLASMITTGLTVIESLTILKQQTTKPQMLKVINDLIASLSEGNSLSQALSNHPTVFSGTYIALIRSAEAGGILDKVLARLADNLEKSEEVKKKVKSALFYPGIVVGAIGLVIIIMNVAVIPQMSNLYKSLNVKLPLTTQIILFGSSIVRALLPFSIFIIIGLIIAYKRIAKTARGIRTIDKTKLQAPIFGDIIKLSLLSEVSRTISLLLNSGGSLISGINIASEVAGNYYYATALKSTSTLVEKGVGLSVALQNQKIFPPMLIQMVKVGESTGRLDESLLKVSEYFERDLDHKVKTLTTAIEPLLIIFLGVSVGVLIYSIITPIYSLISSIQ